MLGKLAIGVLAAVPSLSRPLLRAYTRRHGAIPEKVQWIHSELQRRLIPNPSVRLVSIADDLRMEIDLANSMGQAIYYGGSHEPELVQFLRAELRPGMTVVDGGANVGEVTLLASRLVGSGQGTVVAFEVSPRTLPRLKRNVAMNRLDNVEIVEQALGENDGTVSFHLGEGDDSGSSSLSIPHNYTGESLSVPCVTLDSSMASRNLSPDLIKLDIEGAELAALKGARRVLSGPRPPTLVFEYHQDVAQRMGWQLADMEAFLASVGYGVVASFGQDALGKRVNMVARRLAR